MLIPLKTLEQNLARLIDLVAQTRADNLALRETNLKLHTQNKQIIERMAQAQKHIDVLLQSLEQQAEQGQIEQSNESSRHKGSN